MWDLGQMNPVEKRIRWKSKEEFAMKKTIFAMIVLGGSTACAFAQSSAPPSANAGVAPEQACADCPDKDGGDVRATGKGAAQTGAKSETRAVFTIEPGAPDGAFTEAARASQAAHLLGRPAYVGLAGDFGALMLGPQYTLDFLSVSNGVDATGIGTAGSTTMVGAGVRRVESDSQAYNTRVSGVSAGTAYGEDRIDGSRASRAWGLTLGFDVGPLTVSAAHQNRHVANVRLYDQAGNNMDARNSILSANVRMGWGTAYAAYSVNRGWGSSPLFNPDNPYGASVASMPSTDSHDVLVGVAVPLGSSTTLLASMIHKDDRDLANRDANQFAIGASYAASRSTDFYASYSRIHSMGSAGTPLGYTNGTSAINIGLRHAF
jgi:predicted porin